MGCFVAALVCTTWAALWQIGEIPGAWLKVQYGNVWYPQIRWLNIIFPLQLPFGRTQIAGTCFFGNPTQKWLRMTYHQTLLKTMSL